MKSAVFVSEQTRLPAGRQGGGPVWASVILILREPFVKCQGVLMHLLASRPRFAKASRRQEGVGAVGEGPQGGKSVWSKKECHGCTDIEKPQVTSTYASSTVWSCIVLR
jgi:hypothetical protein